MGNEHLTLLKQGTAVWNQWRKDHPEHLPDVAGDLSGWDLKGADLSRLELSQSNMRGTNLAHANLNEALVMESQLQGISLGYASLIRTNFGASDLTDADMVAADLGEANLYRANLTDADLSYADLGTTWFHRTRLTRTRFTRAVIWNTAFTSVDLSEAVGLEDADYRGPSSLGIDSLIQSGGNIPEVFLRGVGLPDTFIDYAASLVNKPIQFYSCFISYSTKDQDFADRLYADLQAKDVRCWFAPEDMKIGDKLWDRIDQSIRLYEKLLVVLSENSVKSEWVEDEVTKAFAEERRRGKTMLFPIRVDNAVMETNEAWAVKIRDSRHIGDFRQWKDHDGYQKAFTRRLRDLKQSDDEDSR